MLARAERRHRQATKLVEKWKLRIEELERTGVEARQARLWSEEHSDLQAVSETPCPVRGDRDPQRIPLTDQ